MSLTWNWAASAASLAGEDMATNASTFAQSTEGATLAHPSATEFGIEVARALAGALIFALPMLMTMEMWWLGAPRS